MRIKFLTTAVLLSVLESPCALAHRPVPLICVGVDRALAVQQWYVQSDKKRSRFIKDYEDEIFRAATRGKNPSGPIRDYLLDYIKPNYKPEKNPGLWLEFLLAVRSKLGRPIHWMDAGGGIGVAMREVRASQKISPEDLLCTNVDIHDWEMGGAANELAWLKERRPGVMDPQWRPDYVQADASSVNLNGRQAPDVITSIESLEYLPNKLKAFCHWYNLLAENGFLILNAEHAWPKTIYERDGEPGKAFMDFCNILKRNGIEILAGPRGDGTDFLNAQTILIRKKPGTELKLNFDLEAPPAADGGYVHSVYLSPKPALPVISVVKQKPARR